MTQGRDTMDQWVTHFYISYSEDAYRWDQILCSLFWKAVLVKLEIPNFCFCLRSCSIFKLQMKEVKSFFVLYQSCFPTQIFPSPSLWIIKLYSRYDLPFFLNAVQ
jgi:hypothetical protein